MMQGLQEQMGTMGPTDFREASLTFKLRRSLALQQFLRVVEWAAAVKTVAMAELELKVRRDRTPTAM